MIEPVLNVPDVDAAVRFYTDTLGFASGSTLPGPDGKAVFGTVLWGQAMLMFQSEQPSAAQSPRGVHFELYLGVPDDQDIDALYAGLQAKRITVTLPIKDEYWGARTFQIEDLNGFRLRFGKTVRQMSVEEVAEYTRAGGN
jgi:uncharacterized glyoxalase superfamily protein PhnB